MRELKDFTTREWLRLKPVDHFLIQVCNDMLQSLFTKLRPKSLEPFLQNVEQMAGENVGLVIAYEKPWVLDWLLKMAARNLVEGTLLVFDNSRRQEARREIAHICRDHNVPCLALPPSPTWHPNRSNGMAMTWVYRNVVRVLRPRTFSFIDHDLIPMKKIELGATIGNQAFYGALKVGKWGWWTLWAGYCSYDFSAVHHRPLNFLNDFSRDLDTGGRNWSPLYKFFDRTQLRFAPREKRNFMDPLRNSPAPCRVHIVDDRWIHLVGAGHRSVKFQEGRDLYQRIITAACEGAPLEELVGK